MKHHKGLTTNTAQPSLRHFKLEEIPIDCDEPRELFDDTEESHKLYGKFIWSLENFDRRKFYVSSALDVAGMEWHVQCNSRNRLIFTLVLPMYVKYLQGGSCLVQFSIGLLNEKPEKSICFDSLHRFSMDDHYAEHKKFIELSELEDGFVFGGALLIYIRLQIIREKQCRPFRYLSMSYKRDMTCVYHKEVEEKFQCFAEGTMHKFRELMKDNNWCRSFSECWLKIEDKTKCDLLAVGTDVIFKKTVKLFFKVKEITSTLVMDYLFSGFKSLECESGREEKIACPFHLNVRVENNMFVVEGDVLQLLQKITKDEDGSFVEEIKESNDMRLTELGQRILEIFVLDHIISTRFQLEQLRWEEMEKQIKKNQEQLEIAVKEHLVAEQLYDQRRKKQLGFEPHF